MLGIKKDEFKKIFLHDLKNKLFTIKLNLDLIKTGKIDREKEKEILEKLSLTSDEIFEALQDYFELEKFKSLKLIKYEKIDLGEYVETVVNELEIFAQRLNVKIFYVKPKEPFYINASKEWLKKALTNIIHNSIKYNRQNGRVFINLHKEKNGYLIIIKDTGIGISEDKKKNIFEEFYSSNKTGSGIGLNTAKAIIESHSGIISFESTENKGSNFYIYLPKISKKLQLRLFFLVILLILAIFQFLHF